VRERGGSVGMGREEGEGQVGRAGGSKKILKGKK